MDQKEKSIGRRALALLQQGPFRRYIIGSLISDSGTWMQMMAQSWVLSGLTNKAILLGLVNFAAVSLDRSVFHGSRLIGPSVAGFFIGWWGAASAFFTNAFSFLALILALISLPKRTI